MKKLMLLFVLFGFITFTTACGGGTTEEAKEEAPTEEVKEEEVKEEEVKEEEPTVEEVDTTVTDKTEEAPVEKK